MLYDKYMHGENQMGKRAYFKKYLAGASVKAEPFSPTPRQLSRAYNIINHCLFDDQLRRPPLQIKYMTDAYGICYGTLDDGKPPIFDPTCDRIVMNTKFKSKRQFIEVHAHEMVHQYQVEFQNRIDHGKTFWAWKDKFADYNIKLRLQG